MAAPPSSSPTASQFAEVLFQEGDRWFDVGIFLGASTVELKEIDKNHSIDGVTRCLIELHDCLKKKKPLTWENIADTLTSLRNNSLADKIRSDYIRCTSNGSTSMITTQPMNLPTNDRPSDRPVVKVKDNIVDENFQEYQSLSERFSSLTLMIWKSFEAAASNINMQQMQALVEHQCGPVPLPQNEVTLGNIFDRLQKNCSILNFRPLTFIVDTFLSNSDALAEELGSLKASVDRFKKYAKMVDLVSLIKLHHHFNDDQAIVKLKLQDFWSEFKMMQFEFMMNAILETVYDQLSHITVGTGCICVSWNIQLSVDYSKLLPKLSLEFLQIVGVISLHIGDDVIYNVGEVGCKTLEAAMLQAIELKNTRAIELLLAVGCNPEVAAYKGDHAVTNVVNIRETSVDDDSAGGGVEHVCVLGHNEHIEAIVDTCREPECASCNTKEKQIIQLHRQIADTLPQKKKDIFAEHNGKKDAEIQDLNKDLEEKDLSLEIETFPSKHVDADKDAEIEELTEQLKEKDILNKGLIEKLSSEHDMNQAKKDAEIEELTEQLKEKDILNKGLIEKLSSEHDMNQAKKDAEIEELTEQLKEKDILNKGLIEKLSSEHDMNQAKKDAEIEELTEQLKEKDILNKGLIEKLSSEHDMSQAKKDAEIEELTEQLKEKDTLADTLQQKNKGLSLEIEKLSSQHDTNQAKKDAEIEELTEQLKEKVKLADTLQLTIETLSSDHQKSGAIRAKKAVNVHSTEQQLRSTSTDLPLTSSEQVKTKGEKFPKAVEGKEIQSPKKPLSCTAVLPHQRLGIGAEMKVKVITGVTKGKQSINGGSPVRASLSCNREECPVTDNGDGTNLVSVIPQQLGQHHLSITVNGAHIKDSPFTLNIVPQPDYTQLKEPSQTITGFNRPQCIAFSDSDMFVTNSDDHCIYVYDKSGNKKATFGSKGTGELQFQYPRGIDISNGVVYVAELVRHKIHKLTTGGEFIGTFGSKGSGIGQFQHPNDVKISPDGRVYIADWGNCRVQVFNRDWTISHVIDSSKVPDGNKFFFPRSIAFDLSGDVHVTAKSSVAIFTPTGQFVRHYGGSEIAFAEGIAIDPSGNSLVTSWGSHSVSVYDPSGRLVRSIGGLHDPTGVSVSLDGSVWVADMSSKRLVKY